MVAHFSRNCNAFSAWFVCANSTKIILFQSFTIYSQNITPKSV